jgi:hypothetical protein
MTNWLETPKEPPKKVIDETGREILLYKNGMKKEASTGHIINPPNRAKFNSEQGRELANERHEKVRHLTRREILRRTKEAHPGIEMTEEEAYAIGAGQVWEDSVLKGKYPRDKISALEALGKLSGFTPRQGQPQVGLPANDNGINIFASFSGDDLLGLASALKEVHEEKKHHDE